MTREKTTSRKHHAELFYLFAGFLLVVVFFAAMISFGIPSGLNVFEGVSIVLRNVLFAVLFAVVLVVVAMVFVSALRMPLPKPVPKPAVLPVVERVPRPIVVKPVVVPVPEKPELVRQFLKKYSFARKLASRGYVELAADNYNELLELYERIRASDLSMEYKKAVYKSLLALRETIELEARNQKLRRLKT